MIALSVTVDAQDVLRSLRGLERASKYAVVTALNGTANDVQAAIRDHVKATYMLRRESFILRTVKIPKEARASVAADRFEVVVQIDPERDFLAKFEDGGVKTPKTGRHVAVPHDVRTDVRQVIPKSKRPRALLDQGRQAGSAGRAVRYFLQGKRIMQAVGKGVGRVLKTLYVLPTSVRIPKNLQFVERANTTVDKRWAIRAEQAVERELSRLR